MAASSKYHWFFKYKLYHLPLWFIYHCMWWTLMIGSVSAVANNILYTPYSIKFLFYVVFQAVGVYFNLYFLIPRFLEKGRYVQYVSLLIITIISVAALIVPGYYVSAWISGRSLADLYGVQPGNYFYFFQLNTLSSSAASMTLAMSVKLAKNWIETKQRERLLEKEKLETELKFLKSQFNPHFLFNTINSIFVLIHKNPDMASESLAKFSELLRYQLYECNEQQIPLSHELIYLENFIELERLRQEQNVELSIEMEELHLQAGNFTIAPFILMPFIENAFKHVSQQPDQPNWIRMHLRFDKHQLHFDISNSISSQRRSAEVLPYSGIGLKNVQRRLDLIYPASHQLTIQKETDQFRILLQLDLFPETLKKVS
ncbi:sensor histidine kinase [Chitinophaga sp. SYP-B3965]|uniref:sensor histidine kinase n=1 Tax=Chitinophaga sp. SYP-B3965 TaxID=2663120 RepID=UPI00352C70B0